MLECCVHAKRCEVHVCVHIIPVSAGGHGRALLSYPVDYKANVVSQALEAQGCDQREAHLYSIPFLNPGTHTNTQLISVYMY